MKISTVFTVTDYKTGVSVEEVIEGYGQEAITTLRKKYPKFIKIIIDCFEFDEAEKEEK